MVDGYQDFIGRRPLVNKIYARIGAGRPQSVSIVGDHKIGKSSLLWYLAHENTKKEMLNNPDSYIFLFIPCRTEKPLTLESFTSTVYKLAKKFSAYTEDNDTDNLKYNYFKKMVENLHKEGKKIILFLDDFNLVTLNPAFPLEFFSFLRSLANNYNLAYVTTSYDDLQKLCVSKDIEESPFFNIFTNMSLRGFEAEEIDVFLERYNRKSDGLQVSDKDQLIALVGNAPYPLRIACAYLYQIKQQNGKLQEDFYTKLESVLTEKLHNYHQHLWQQMEKSHQEILMQLANGKQISGAKEYILRDLNRKSYILTKDAKSKISSILLRKFVLQMKRAALHKQGLIDRIGYFFKRILVKQDSI